MNLFKSTYVTNVLTLLTSALTAQLLTLVFTPILTRAYAPEAFGVFNAFVSYSGTLAALLFFSVELSIARPKSIGNVNRIFGLLLAIGGGASLFIFISIVFEFDIYNYLGFDRIFEYKYIFFVGILIVGSNLVLNALITRLGIFSVYAKSQVFFVILRFGVTISLYYLGSNFFGLILGFVIASFVNIAYLSYKTKIFTYSPKMNHLSIIATAKKYKDLILHNTPANIVNILIVSFPVFYIFKNFGAVEVGLFALAYRMILLPVTMVNKAIGQVLYKEMIEKKHDVSYISKLLIKNALFLGISFPVFVILYFWGENIFSLAFGENWSGSGEFASIMAPYVMLNFIVSPLSFYFVVYDKNKLFLFFSTFYLSTLILGSIVYNSQDIYSFVKLYTINNMLYYITILISIIVLQYKNHGRLAIN
ncbi:MAG: oligosaccharide flippase family protein [Alteromonadales bacterium]|nr:oligosaccharide flippase family protein [Alteromonadales bacterium]